MPPIAESASSAWIGRIGVYGAVANDLDNEGLYATNIITSGIPSTEGKTTAVDYLRQAAHFSACNLQLFYNQNTRRASNASRLGPRL